AVRFIGSGNVREAERQFELIIDHCKRTKNNKLLIDIRGVEGGFSLLDKYYLAGRFWFSSHYLAKVAAVDTPEKFDPRKFAEQVAQNGGINLRAFTDFQAAVNWLLE